MIEVPKHEVAADAAGLPFVWLEVTCSCKLGRPRWLSRHVGTQKAPSLQSVTNEGAQKAPSLQFVDEWRLRRAYA